MTGQLESHQRKMNARNSMVHGDVQTGYDQTLKFGDAKCGKTDGSWLTVMVQTISKREEGYGNLSRDIIET